MDFIMGENNGKWNGLVVLGGLDHRGASLFIRSAVFGPASSEEA
jgi:hypothetical protein